MSQGCLGATSSITKLCNKPACFLAHMFLKGVIKGADSGGLLQPVGIHITHFQFEPRVNKFVIMSPICPYSCVVVEGRGTVESVDGRHFASIFWSRC